MRFFRSQLGSFIQQPVIFLKRGAASPPLSSKKLQVILFVILRGFRYKDSNKSGIRRKTAVDKPLHAITLHRPWAYAITHLGKPVENRTWKCWLKEGSPLAIHAGKQWKADAAQWIESEGLGKVPPEDQNPKGIVAIARFVGNTTAMESPWFFGPIGWQLTNIITIPPIACTGKQGLWKVPDELSPTISGYWRDQANQ